MKIKFQPKRRKFLVLTATALAGIGCFVSSLPFLNSIHPLKEIVTSSTKEVNLSSIEKVILKDKSILTHNRTRKNEEIKTPKETSMKNFMY